MPDFPVGPTPGHLTASVDEELFGRFRLLSKQVNEYRALAARHREVADEWEALANNNARTAAGYAACLAARDLTDMSEATRRVRSNMEASKDA